MAGQQAATLERINRLILTVLLIIMLVELAVAVYRLQWLTAFLTLVIVLITAMPLVLRKYLPVIIPLELHLLVILFVFAALFLGEIQHFYQQYWWWDIVLHGLSGLLLGMIGFILVYMLNENERIEVYLRPSFVALFAFMFAVSTGVFWELYEFFMDRQFGTTMQKPMLGDESGLTDTMYDLLMDTFGAFIISIWGWWYLRKPRGSLMERWIAQFVASNPRLFMAQKYRS